MQHSARKLNMSGTKYNPPEQLLNEDFTYYDNEQSFGMAGNNYHNAEIQYIQVEKPVTVEKIIEKPVIRQVVVENLVIQDVIREVIVEVPYRVTVEQPIYVQADCDVDQDAACKQMVAEVYGQLGCVMMENARLRMKIAELEAELPLDQREEMYDLLPRELK